MAKAKVESLWRAEPPWTVTYRASRGDAYELAWKLQGSGAVARVLRGSKMTTLDGFFTEFGAALQFPHYFGENWPALDECLTDLSWLPGPVYVLIVTEANLLFRDDEFDSLPTFLRIAESAAQAWAEPTDLDKPWGHGSVPFHFLLQVPDDALKAWKERLAASGHEAPTRDFETAG